MRVLIHTTGMSVPDGKVDVRLPGKGNSNTHNARPVHLIITMIKWIRTSKWSMKKSLSVQVAAMLTGQVGSWVECVFAKKVPRCFN